MKKIDFLLLTVIILIGFIVRLYKINTPLADLHSWRQADTAAVARNFVKDGFDLLHPHYDDLSSNQSASGKDNLQGLRLVEFPIYNAIFAYIYKLFPFLPIEVYGRLTTAIFSLIIIAVIYYLALKESSRIAAVVGAITFAVFPFFVFFSRVILPETMATTLALLSVFFLYIYAHDKRKFMPLIFFLFSMLSFALAVLVKPTAGFYGIALLFIFGRKFRFNFVKKLPVYLFFALAIIPFVLWRLYIRNYPEGIPPSDWLITSVNTYQGLQNIFFRPAFFRWIFYERINNLILGGYLTFFFIIGILAKPKKYILYGLLLSAFTYLFVFQGGNVQHEYYQTIILPAIALFIGIGTAYLFNNQKSFLHIGITTILVIFLFFLSFFFSFYNVKGYYDYPAELPQIAKIITTLTSPNDKIVTDRMGDTTLLYLADRRGAPSIYKDPEELKKIGYSYLVTLNSDEIKKLKQEKKYSVVFENDKFVLFKL